MVSFLSIQLLAKKFIQNFVVQKLENVIIWMSEIVVVERRKTKFKSPTETEGKTPNVMQFPALTRRKNRYITSPHYTHLFVGAPCTAYSFACVFFSLISVFEYTFSILLSSIGTSTSVCTLNNIIERVSLSLSLFCP